MKRIVYPGTFDPIHNGHLDIARKAAELFDELILVVAVNQEKSPLFNDKESFLAELDTTINDYTIKELKQFYKTNRLYEPVIIWVRGDEEIRKTTSILLRSGPTVLLRKFVLFNAVDKPDPRAGFYVSFLTS